ncbi:hypothetical protein, partial [Acinetobacter pittii]|uniref:hypothetical protein n=1 Tax=Acinetobacter pittii TaxID=48296 RepID=UPI002271C327
MFLLFINFYLSFFKKIFMLIFCKKLIKTAAYNYAYIFVGEFKHEVRQFQKPYDNQQAEQISLMV